MWQLVTDKAVAKGYHCGGIHQQNIHMADAINLSKTCYIFISKFTQAMANRNNDYLITEL